MRWGLLMLIAIIFFGCAGVEEYRCPDGTMVDDPAKCPRCPPSCDDGNPCTNDLCDPSTFQCVHIPLNGSQPGCDANIPPCKLQKCVNGACKLMEISPCCGNGICEKGEAPLCHDCFAELIIENVGKPMALKVDDHNIYFLDSYSGTLYMADKKDFNLTNITSNLTSPNDLEVGDEFLYVSEFLHPGSVKHIGRTTGEMAEIAYELWFPSSMALGEGMLCWTEAEKVACVSSTGGEVEELALSQINPISIKIQNHRAYWVESAEVGYVDAMPLDGSLPRPIRLAMNVNYPTALAVDDDYVYFWSRGSGLQKVPVDGGKVEMLAPPDENLVPDILVDENFIYWCDYSENGSVKRLKKSGGDIVVLQHSAYPSSLALDAVYIYWTEEGSGSILRMLR